MPILVLIGAAVALVLLVRGKVAVSGGTGGSSPASSSSSRPTSSTATPGATAPLASLFTPFHYTNRPTGPLVGPAGQIISSSPGETSADLGIAKTAVGYVGNAVQLAQQVGVQVVAGVGTVIAAVGGALGLASALTSNAKTGLAETAQQNQILTSTVALGSAVIQAAALAVSTAAAGLASVVLLPIAAFFTAQSINDNNNEMVRAKKEVRDYQNAATQVREWTPGIVSCSDRLDEFRFLPRVTTRDQKVKWLTDNYVLAITSMNRGALMSPDWDHLRNGEHVAGIPGRDITNLNNMVAAGISDALLLYFVCMDGLVRLGAPVPSSPVFGDWAAIGFPGLFFTNAGFPRDAWPGIVPGATVTTTGTWVSQFQIDQAKTLGVDVSTATPEQIIAATDAFQYQAASSVTSAP